jgi:hypothetical protein
MRRSTQRKLASRFRYSKLAQLLIYRPWFRATLVAMVLLGLVVALLLPKIWNVAPAGWTQEIRISGLDMLQAWSLSRTAERQERAGKPDAALYSWGAALANYPTRPALCRGYLRTALVATNDLKLMRTAVGQADLLLRLTGTNQADVELAARVLDRFDLPQAVLAVVRGHTNALSPELQRAAARALFDIGAYPAFVARWQTNQAVLEVDPGLVLRHSWLREVSSRGDEAVAARQQIETAARAGTNRIIANRLLLLAAVNRGNGVGAQDALNALVELKADRLRDHAALWRLLCATGRATEAGTLIQAYQGQPTSVDEAAELFDLAMASEQTQRAEAVLAWSLEQRGYTTQMVSRWAAVLRRKEAWADLRQLGLDIRLRPYVSPTLQAYSHFVEGQALLGEQNVEQAQAAFERLGEFDYDDPRFALGMAGQLVQTGHSRAALPLLARLESKLAGSPDYWLVLTTAAVAEKNSVLLLRSAEKLYTLDTNNVLAASNYAAALAVQGTKPELTLQLTTELVNRFPEAAMMNINHADALLLNSRVSEAREHLGRVDLGKLAGAELREYQFIAFKAATLAQDRAAATNLLAQVDRSQLMPPQRIWLEAAERNLLRITNAPPANP